MKNVIAVLLALLAVCHISGAEITCDECKEAADGLKSYLLGDDSLAEQISILSETVCIFADIPTDCEELLNTYWTDMAQVLYTHFLEQQKACELLQLCSRRMVKMWMPREWTCEECTSIMTQLGEYMAKQETIEEAVALLQGEEFCGDGSHTDDCGVLVKEFVQAALPVLSQVVVGRSEDLCSAVVGVC